jgi:restriction system protein
MNTKRNKKTIVLVFRIILIIILLPIVLIYLILKKIQSSKQKKRNKESVKVFSLSQIDSLSGIEFEKFLKSLFEKQGYAVSLTKASGDFGADLVCKKNGKITLVQAKCFGKKVGPRAVQEIIGARNHYKAYDAMVVTNNYFSKEANILAAENNVKLLDRDVLESLITKYDIHFERTNFKYSCMESQERQSIEMKYKFWI